MRLGTTATRTSLTENQKEALYQRLLVLVPMEVHHGDCVGGDEVIHEFCLELGYPVVVHPPENNSYRAWTKGWASRLDPLPYIDRNRVIVRQTDALLACPAGPERQRSGTWSTVRFAQRTGKPVTLVWPDGRVTVR